MNYHSQTGLPAQTLKNRLERHIKNNWMEFGENLNFSVTPYDVITMCRSIHL